MLFRAFGRSDLVFAFIVLARKWEQSTLFGFVVYEDLRPRLILNIFDGGYMPSMRQPDHVKLSAPIASVPVVSVSYQPPIL